MTKYHLINQTKYLYWKRFYWLPLKEFKHACGRKLTIYKKFRKLKGELQEVRTGNRFCPTCGGSYD